MSDCEAETERPDTLARSALASPRPELFWGGRSVSAATGETFDVSNPSDGKYLIRVAAAGLEDIDQAVQAAYQQFEQGHWPRMSGAERGGQLLRFADLIERDRFKRAALETLDNGNSTRWPPNSATARCAARTDPRPSLSLGLVGSMWTVWHRRATSHVPALRWSHA